MKRLAGILYHLLAIIVLLPLLPFTFHASSSAIVAHGDTVRTSIGAITVPTNVSRITGVWCYALGGPGATTLENLTGIFDLVSTSLPLQPMQLPLEGIICLTSTSGVFSPRVWPVNIQGVAGAEIECFVTLDMAQTVAGTCRWGLIYA